jgi:hypothetical protein
VSFLGAFDQPLICLSITVMAALEEVLKTSFIIFCLMEISLSIENGKLHKIHIYCITDLL